MAILEVTGEQRALARVILDKVEERFVERDAAEAERLSPFVQALNDLKTAVAASGTATAAALGAFVPAVNAAMAMESPVPIVNIPAPQVTIDTKELAAAVLELAKAMQHNGQCLVRIEEMLASRPTSFTVESTAGGGRRLVADKVKKGK